MLGKDDVKEVVRVVAPASGKDNWKEVVKESSGILSVHGIELVHSVDMVQPYELGFWSNSFEKRYEDFLHAMTEDSARIVWAYRGGYGSGVIAEKMMNDNVVLRNKKILIGLSDITMLHLMMSQHYNMLSIYAHGIDSVPKHPDDVKYIIDALEGRRMYYQLTPMNAQAIGFSKEAVITGGTLTLLSMAVGTKLHPQFAGKIVFLEDVDEKGYSIHRYLTHLAQSGVLKDVSALLFGDFVLSDGYIDQAIQYFVDTYCIENSIPCYRVQNVGHGEHNTAIVIGHTVNIHHNVMQYDSIALL